MSDQYSYFPQSVSASILIPQKEVIETISFNGTVLEANGHTREILGGLVASYVLYAVIQTPDNWLNMSDVAQTLQRPLYDRETRKAINGIDSDLEKLLGFSPLDIGYELRRDSKGKIEYRPFTDEDLIGLAGIRLISDSRKTFRTTPRTTSRSIVSEPAESFPGRREVIQIGWENSRPTLVPKAATKSGATTEPPRASNNPRRTASSRRPQPTTEDIRRLVRNFMAGILAKPSGETFSFEDITQTPAFYNQEPKIAEAVGLLIELGYLRPVLDNSSTVARDVRYRRTNKPHASQPTE